METAFPLIFALVMGFSHAFEADHLVAVSTIVTRRTSFFAAAKDGLFWGLGHTSTIFIIGAIMIVGKVVISEQTFHYLEACVGGMLVVLGGVRLWKLYPRRSNTTAVTTHLQAQEDSHEHSYQHSQAHSHEHSHSLAYGVGAVHGLAGSGALVLLVMTNIAGAAASMLYLLNFGMGSMGGMLVAAGVFSLPFSKKFSMKLHTTALLPKALTLVSAMACVGYGVWIIIENLIQ
ncbi:MAG: urease accessory protein [Candidatus Kapabacteria bacterium]|jgi:hypothetical protein|nr:urease accessory protein [Candidatus Kapabacteria bacterium]